MADRICLTKEASGKFNNRPALIVDRTVIKFTELEQLVTITTDTLAERGIRPGDRVAIIEPNRIEYPIALFALWRLRATACLMSNRQPPPVLVEMADRTRCRWQLVFPNSDKEKTLLSIPRVQIDIRPDHISKPVNTDVTLNLMQPTTILFTSGSSGPSKAVLHNLGNHYYNAVGSNRNISVRPNDRWLLSLPLYHVGGLSILFRCLLGGGVVVIANTGGNLIDQIARHKITHLSLVPTQLRRLLRDTAGKVDNLKTLKAVLLGGGTVPQPLVRQALQAGLPVYRSYGLTEMASQVATSITPLDDQLRLLDYRELKISDQGEILVRGETRFTGYVVGNELIEPFDSDGWFATGDIGVLDNDGELKVTGRRDNMFISGGENIHPEQIEQALCSIPGVEEAVVVPVEDTEFGHRPVAFIRLGQPALNENELIDHLTGLLPHYMIPVTFYPFPSSYEPSGMKPDRSVFSELAAKLRRSSR